MTNVGLRHFAVVVALLMSQTLLLMMMPTTEAFPSPISVTATRRDTATALAVTSQRRSGKVKYEDYEDNDEDEDVPWGDFAGDDWQYGYENDEEYSPNSHPSSASSQPSQFSTPGETSGSSHFFSKKSLSDPAFKISEEFDNLCRGAGIRRPSKIQNLAWPILSKGQHAIVADQTGSGKTLAYMIPLLQRAMNQPKINRPGTPRILVLSPTAELADQTRAVSDRLSTYTNFRTMVLTANGKFTTSIRDQIRLLRRSQVDVMISTPGRLSTILRTRNSGVDLSELSAIVLDEVDVLMVDETFGPQLRTVGAAAPVETTQFIFVTATLPNDIAETVEKEFPGVVQVRGPGLHRVAPTVKERLVDVSVPPRFNRDAAFCFDVKSEQLLKALRETRCRRTIVFCNTVESCRKVENLLKRSDRRGQIIEAIPYHNALTPEARNQNMAIFSKGRKGAPEKTDYVLVCTDRAARGVDFESSPVDHVVIFDFPKDPAEYVRRVGRTARAGRDGTSTVFAFGWQLPIARSVMGKTLETFTAAGQIDEDDEHAEFRKRRRKHCQKKDDIVKGSIEEKRLWKR